MSKFQIPERVLFVCTGSKCAKRGGKSLCKRLKGYRKAEVVRMECTDRCDFAPVLSIQPDNIWLNEYTEKEVIKLLDKLED